MDWLVAARAGPVYARAVAAQQTYRVRVFEVPPEPKTFVPGAPRPKPIERLELRFDVTARTPDAASAEARARLAKLGRPARSLNHAPPEGGQPILIAYIAAAAS